jgi:TPP-dependent 2-oxoacid decarboxylase
LTLDKVIQNLYNRIATSKMKIKQKEEKEMAVFPKAKKAQPKRLTKATKKFLAVGPVIPYLETWDTRYGASERIVYRQNGKFIDSVSLDALRKGTKVPK